jgi:sugar phosphate isomerase/epimerase
MTFQYAICNETFRDWPHERVCESVAAAGYSGLEIAPFTLCDRIDNFTPRTRSDVRRVAERAGLRLIGLHWLLAKTQGFHLTSPDPAVRRATAAYLGELARAAADLGGSFLVLGSPQQRQLVDGVTPQLGAGYARECIESALPALEDTQIVLCIEPLGPAETNFLNTCEEALSLANSLNHPLVRIQLDVKAMATEGRPVADTVLQFGAAAGHFHANDPNRRGPGFGDENFVHILSRLRETSYRGWISVEVFDYSPDPETIARESLRYLRDCERQINSAGGSA